MSFNHSHEGVPCQTFNCALPYDTPGVYDVRQLTEKELREMPVEAYRHFQTNTPAAVHRAEVDTINMIFDKYQDALRAQEGHQRPGFEDMIPDPVKAAEVLLRNTTGLDTEDEHGQDTPKRFVEMLRELTTPKPIKFTTFASDSIDEMIVVEAIPFVSLCSHHIIPFIGKAHIGYIPDKKLAGLSKFARVVHHFARALQVQERLTKQIADFLEENLQPLGVAVVLRAEHLCMSIRGAQASGALTYTAAMRGRFADHERTAKAEFLAEINRG